MCWRPSGSPTGRGPSRGLLGGMKRRLNIGIGLLHEPQLLVLDEPTVGVDPQSRDSILASVEQLGATGIGVLVHHALHGRGRAALRPGRNHRPWRADRRGHPPGAGRPDRSSMTTSASSLDVAATQWPTVYGRCQTFNRDRRRRCHRSRLDDSYTVAPANPDRGRRRRGQGAVGRGDRTGPGGGLPTAHRPGAPQLEGRRSTRPQPQANSGHDRAAEHEGRGRSARRARRSPGLRARCRSVRYRRPRWTTSVKASTAHA